jgi:aminodeoxyfutalosine deaminase
MKLHLHMEGSMEPGTVVELAARYGDSIEPGDVAKRYATPDFAAFIQAYLWATSYLRTPQDYALVARCLAEQLLEQNVVYAEVTLSIGVMLLRKQDVAANFRAIREATTPFEPGLRMQWIFDTVRQFGPQPAWDVARCAVEMMGEGVVAYGIGGDELSIPAEQFRPVYDFVASKGLHRLAHAGEIGGPEEIWAAIEHMAAERIGHGIAAFRDPRLMDFLIERSISLEVCPTSNIRTGALARQLGTNQTTLREHPLPALLRAGVPLCLSTDDPAMFETTLRGEYEVLANIGLTTEEIVRVARGGFSAALVRPDEKAIMLSVFHTRATALGLL